MKFIPNYEDKRQEAIPWSFILGSKINHKEILLNFLKTMDRTNIAKHLGVSNKGLRIKFDHEGIPPLEKKTSIRTKILNLKNHENMTSREIAEAIGNRIESVARICRRHKISYRRILE